MKKLHMKKILTIFASLCVITTISAQNHDDNNIWGIKGYTNISKISADVIGYPAIGVGLEFNYQKSLSDSHPFYLETGLGYNATKLVNPLTDLGDDSSALVFNTINIPISINYKFFVGDATIYPSVGFSYQYHMGEIEEDRSGYYYYESIESPDLSFRTGITGEFNQHFIISYYYESSVLFRFSLEEYNTSLTTHMISLGYRF